MSRTCSTVLIVMWTSDLATHDSTCRPVEREVMPSCRWSPGCPTPSAFEPCRHHTGTARIPGETPNASVYPCLRVHGANPSGSSFRGARISLSLNWSLFGSVPRIRNFSELFVVRLARIAVDPGDSLVRVPVMRRSGVERNKVTVPRGNFPDGGAHTDHTAHRES
jgi:hypothetical protein